MKDVKFTVDGSSCRRREAHIGDEAAEEDEWVDEVDTCDG